MRLTESETLNITMTGVDSGENASKSRLVTKEKRSRQRKRHTNTTNQPVCEDDVVLEARMTGAPLLDDVRMNVDHLVGDGKGTGVAPWGGAAP